MEPKNQSKVNKKKKNIFNGSKEEKKRGLEKSNNDLFIYRPKSWVKELG